MRASQLQEALRSLATAIRAVELLLDENARPA